jgi:hypothetical protein
MSSYQGLFVYTKRSQRINVEFPADFQIVWPKKNLKKIPLNIKSLSGGGVSIISPLPLSVGTQIEMTLYNFAVIITLTAEVIWVEKVKDSQGGKFKCGLTFTQISDEDLVHIYHFVCKSLGNELLNPEIKNWEHIQNFE